MYYGNADTGMHTGGQGPAFHPHTAESLAELLRDDDDAAGYDAEAAQDAALREAVTPVDAESARMNAETASRIFH